MAPRLASRFFLKLGALTLAVAWTLGVAAPAPAAPPGLPRLGPAPNFALTTQQNDRLWLTHLRGRLVVLAFACTRCASCPGLLPSLADLGRGLGEAAGRQVFFAVVSVDPRRDTPRVLRQFARDRRVDLSAWVFLTGAPAEVEVVTRRYGVEVWTEPGGVTGDCLVALIDRAGFLRARYGPAEVARLGADLEALRVEAGGP